MLHVPGSPVSPPIVDQTDGRSPAAAVVVLTPSESKRLIARGVAALPEVRSALQKGWVVISRGTTTAYVAQEILGVTVSPYRYTVGVVTDGTLASVPRELGRLPYILHHGQVVEGMTGLQAVTQFGGDDVFIKGANAVDPAGNAGILTASDDGGTIGTSVGYLIARGSHVVVPVGLEKLIPSVPEAARRCGTRRFKHAMGYSVGMMPLVTARVVTEIQALAILTGVQATHIGSGGVAGSEGAVVLAIEGTDEQVDQAWELVSGIKGEPPVAKS